MKKTLICGIALAFLCSVGFTATSMAEADKGPADIIMEATIDVAVDPKKPKPAILPHAKHQETLACGDCHHSKDADGKKVDYVDGQETGKCEVCHNSGAGMANEKLNTLKKAAHANCQTCHKKLAKEAQEGEPAKALAKCSTCHPKKKK